MPIPIVWHDTPANVTIISSNNETFPLGGLVFAIGSPIQAIQGELYLAKITQDTTELDVRGKVVMVQEDKCNIQTKCFIGKPHNLYCDMRACLRSRPSYRNDNSRTH